MAPENITPDPDNEPFEPYEYVEEVVEYKDTRGLRTLLALLLAVLLLLLIGLGYYLWAASRVTGGANQASGGNNGMVWVRSIYNWGTAGNEQLIAPVAVAIAPDGTIWSNSQNNVAVAFSPQGTVKRVLRANPLPSKAATGSTVATGTSGKTGVTGVQAVASLAVDSSNDLYVADDAQGYVFKFTPQGDLMRGWGVPGLIRVAVNGSEIAVLSQTSLGAFNQNTGAKTFSFGTRGQGPNQFDLPKGVHIDAQGNVYVADTQNQRVRKFNPSGKLLWDAGTVPDRTFQSHVAAPKGIFQLPSGVTTDGNGRVVVIDAFNYNITVLDGATGKKIASYGSYGPDDGLFDNPSAIAYDPVRDYFVVADTGNNRLQILRIPGSSSGPAALTSRIFDSATWILCLPFIILLLAALLAWWLNRRRRGQAAAAEEPNQA